MTVEDAKRLADEFFYRVDGPSEVSHSVPPSPLADSAIDVDIFGDDWEIGDLVDVPAPTREIPAVSRVAMERLRARCVELGHEVPKTVNDVANLAVAGIGVRGTSELEDANETLETQVKKLGIDLQVARNEVVAVQAEGTPIWSQCV